MALALSSSSTSGLDGVRIVADRQGDPQARAVVFLHGGGQTRRSWAGPPLPSPSVGGKPSPSTCAGHGESDWSTEGDYRVVSFAADVAEVLRGLPEKPVLVGASLGGFTSMLVGGGNLAGHCQRRGFWSNRAEHGAIRSESAFHNFMVTSGIGVRFARKRSPTRSPSTNPHRPRPTDLNGLTTKPACAAAIAGTWHWDPQFISGSAAFPPSRSDPDRHACGG